jgi:hypothetical protein
MAKMITEIKVDCVETTGLDNWEDQIYTVTGFYKGVKVVERTYTAKQKGGKICSGAVFVSRVRNEINKNYHQRGA